MHKSLNHQLKYFTVWRGEILQQIMANHMSALTIFLIKEALLIKTILISGAALLAINKV
jgi:hypothetical protein